MARVLLDLEFGFTHGEPLSITAVDGRDQIAADPDRVKVTCRPDEATIEETIIDRSKTNWMRTTKRTLKDDDKTPEPA